MIYNIHLLKITNFKMQSFNNIVIEVLAHIENQNERLRLENDLIFKYKTLYPYGFNTKLKGYNFKRIDNIYSFCNLFNSVRIINRNTKGSYTLSKKINSRVPY